jgi:hypothetical protein
MNLDLMSLWIGRVIIVAGGGSLAVVVLWSITTWAFGKLAALVWKTEVLLDACRYCWSRTRTRPPGRDDLIYLNGQWRPTGEKEAP